MIALHTFTHFPGTQPLNPSPAAFRFPGPMTSNDASDKLVLVNGSIDPAAFLAEHAKAGRVGLVAGRTWIDRAIQRSQRSLNESGGPTRWAHAFVFEGLRADGYHWVIESDLELHRKHIRLGVQENRAVKYADAKATERIAILDFGLTDEQAGRVVAAGLELVASRARYSIRELMGTYLALKRPDLRSQPNVLARDGAFYCSALVQHLFRSVGLDLAPGLDSKNTTPEDLSRATGLRRMYLWEAEPAAGRSVSAARVKLRRIRVGARRLLRGAKAKLKATATPSQAPV